MDDGEMPVLLDSGRMFDHQKTLIRPLETRAAALHMVSDTI